MDARIVRTRHALQGALLELARDRPLDDITVGDITKRAHVNRSSFYLHYTDKDTLLADALEMQIDRSTGDEDLRTDSPEHMPTGLTDYLNHVQEYASAGCSTTAGRAWWPTDCAAMCTTSSSAP